jgi:hypothetical protein
MMADAQRSESVDEPRAPRRRATRGRPCPAIVEGLRCNGNSEVLNVRQEADRGIRWRRCLSCGHRWRTQEIDE